MKFLRTSPTLLCQEGMRHRSGHSLKARWLRVTAGVAILTNESHKALGNLLISAWAERREHQQIQKDPAIFTDGNEPRKSAPEDPL